MTLIIDQWSMGAHRSHSGQAERIARISGTPLRHHLSAVFVDVRSISSISDLLILSLWLLNALRALRLFRPNPKAPKLAPKLLTYS